MVYLFNNIKSVFEGIPWKSSGEDSEFPLLGALVQSLVKELRSYKSCDAAPSAPPKKTLSITEMFYNLFFHTKSSKSSVYLTLNFHQLFRVS